MKISLNSKFIQGPFGGGMQFANFLKSFLEAKGVEVINHLNDSDIDLILLINPFPFLMKSAAFSFLDAYSYKLRHPKTVIVQRINECDERKGTNYMNKLQIKTSKYSDYIVFIANWLVPLYQKTGLNCKKKYRVILNGADTAIFNSEKKVKYKEGEKLKIVTHHWGAGYLKGHDIYTKLDDLLNLKEYYTRFEFTYIGNLPKNVIYKNTKIIAPLAGIELANELKKHHLYLTASRNEPAGMHHIEGALCGLPLLYINSGALPEYCGKFGICFEETNFEKKLMQMLHEFKFWKNEIIKYDRTAKHMAYEYYQLFSKLLENNDLYQFKKSNPLKSIFYAIYAWFYHVCKKIQFNI